jgi:protein inturned
MDYRNWNESLMELFGKFNICGSCLFYKTSLICSHFSESEMESVEIFLRHMCFKLIYQNCLVREVALWQRIYPKSYHSFNKENDSTKNKVFLLVAAHGNLIMCVMLEENGYNTKHEIETPSSKYLVYFLEEMDDILNHLKVVGIENLARIWINSAKRPQCKPFGGKGSVLAQEETVPLKSFKKEDEESDHDYDSQKSGSGFDTNDFPDAIYKDFTDIIPQTISFGSNKNVLYHLTQLDVDEGMIITTINDNNLEGHNSEILIDIFRKGCIKIHHLLQNSIRFNNFLSHEGGSKISRKLTSMMTIIEKGMMLQVQLESGEQVEFWIVGRLFGKRELFVCYDSSVPQNMIEIAFRIGLNCIG